LHEYYKLKFSKKKINLFEPYITHEEIDETKKILKSKFWASGSGINKVAKFEKEFSKYVGCNDTITVNSGTAALHLAYLLCNPSKKKVLIPSLTFVSSAHAATYNNAKPVFVDIDETTLCMDMNDLEKKLTSDFGMIAPVHFGGFPCNMQKISKLARDFKISVVEDAAHACGSKYNGKKIGSHSDFVCFSFHPVKNLAMPNGGAICLNKNNKFSAEIKSLRWCGITNRKNSSYDVSDLGWNYYMNEISAGIGLVQLKRLDKMNKRRYEIAKIYHKKLNIENKMPLSKDCSYHLFWIRVKNREKFMKNMLKQNIETGIHYKPVNLMKYYKSKKLLKSEQIWTELVSIPMHPNLSNENAEKIVNFTNKFAKN